MNEFSLTTRIVSGKHCLDELKSLNNQKIWLVCDEFLADSPNMDRVSRAIPSNNVLKVYSAVKPDPTVADVARGVAEFISFQPQVMIALGGGSSIDAAKAIRHFARESGVSCERFIAMPTTSGTGSEVTSATVVSVPEQQTKIPLFDNSLLPDTAILDSEQLLSVPDKILAATVIDALTHAVEAYVASGADDFTDALAEKAVSIIFQCLPTAFYHADNLDAKERLHKASTMAGIAFNHAGLGLNHAMVHQLGGQFHLPHGMANAVLLIPVIGFNRRNQKACQRYANLSRAVGLAFFNTSDEQAVDALEEGIGELLKAVKMPVTLNELGVNAGDIDVSMPAMVSATLQDATLKTTPFKPSADDVARLLTSIAGKAS